MEQSVVDIETAGRDRPAAAGEPALDAEHAEETVHYLRVRSEARHLYSRQVLEMAFYDGGFIGGYSKVYVFINRCFNFLVALVLLALASPIIGVLAAAVKLQDGKEVFYRGIRLGLNKKPYTMYKLRTLVPNAEQKIGAELLKPSHGLATPLGKLLRDTRLDELPQLYNIVRGDMDFVGPRPVRPAIYEKICRHIKDYDRRFSVKPGLIGYSQLFTPHSTPSAIRTFIDNSFLKRKQRFLWDSAIIIYTAGVIVNTAVTKISRFLWKNVVIKGLLGRYEEKRTFERIKHDDVVVEICDNAKGAACARLNDARLLDINEEAFSIHSNARLDRKKHLYILRTRCRSRSRLRKYKVKTARCRGTVYKETALQGEPYKYLYIIKYEPVSPLNFYIVHQYLLQQSVA